MQTDCRGLALTTTSEGAAKHIDRAVTDFLDYGVTASAQAKAALENDPAFVLAQCFRGYFLLMLETGPSCRRSSRRSMRSGPISRRSRPGNACMCRRSKHG